MADLSHVFSNVLDALSPFLSWRDAANYIGVNSVIRAQCRLSPQLEQYLRAQQGRALKHMLHVELREALRQRFLYPRRASLQGSADGNGIFCRPSGIPFLYWCDSAWFYIHTGIKLVPVGPWRVVAKKRFPCLANRVPDRGRAENLLFAGGSDVLRLRWRTEEGVVYQQDFAFPSGIQHWSAEQIPADWPYT